MRAENIKRVIMMIRGRHKWVPPNILEEINNVRKEDNIERECDAFKKVGEYSKIGREFKKMRDRFIMYDVFGNKLK